MDRIEDLDKNPKIALETDKSDLKFAIVFRPEYDIQICCHLEKLHPFDTCKWGKVAALIKNSSSDKKIKFFQPEEPISDEKLALVHSDKFLSNVKKRMTLVKTSESCLLFFVPVSYSDKVLLKPLRYQTNGTILATSLAMKFGAAINIGGGFHHCSAEKSEGFCFFADITLAIKNIWLEFPEKKLYILIVDCDAHQGNGYARDVLKMSKKEKNLIYILDLFNPNIYPGDEFAKNAINREVHISRRTTDEKYLKLLDYHLKAVVDLDRFKPHLIIYNAGTDVLEGDCLGRLNITALGILKRDEMVFQFAKNIQASIVMLLSGGYQRSNATVIARSIMNLMDVNLMLPVDNNKTI